MRARKWTDSAYLVAIIAASLAIGALIATKYVSPCVCVLAQASQVN